MQKHETGSRTGACFVIQLLPFGIKIANQCINDHKNLLNT